MATELTVHAVHHGEMRVVAQAGQHTVKIDYLMPHAASELIGPTPLQLLLASLAGCSATTVAWLLRRRKLAVAHLEVDVKGSRRSEHPTVITDISMEFVLNGDGLDEKSVAEALRESEELYCPVWNMLKQSTPIKATFRIAPAQT